MASDTTKNCTHCMSNIAKAATVCSSCRRSLNEKWYQNSRLSSFLFFIPLIIIFFYTSGNFEPKFQDYEGEIKITQQSLVTVDGPEKRVVFLIENESDVRWQNLTYQIIALKGEKIINVKTDNSYYWVVQPNSSAYLTVPVYQSDDNVVWQLKVTSLEKRRY